MSSRQHPTIGGLHLREDHPSQLRHNTRELPTEIYYFGGQPGNIAGLVDPTEVFLNEDGTGVVYARDPNLFAVRNPYQGIADQAESGVNPGMVRFLTSPDQALSHYNTNVALGFDWEPEQQTAPSPVSPVSPVSPDSPEAITAETAAPAERSTDSVSREGDAVGSHPSRGNQRRRSTQSAPSAAATNLFSRLTQQRRSAESARSTAGFEILSRLRQQQTAPSQGFTAVNRTQSGAFFPTNPRVLPRNEPAPEVPSRKRKRPTQKSKPQKTKPRTNILKQRATQGALTSACGVVTPSRANPVAKANNNGGFCCPRCQGRFTRAKSVKDHFAKCVEKHGNPQGLRWFDHATLVNSRNHYENRMGTIREASEDEEDEEEGEGDSDEEQDDEEEDFSDAYRGGYGDEPDGEQDDGDGEYMQGFGDRSRISRIHRDRVEDDGQEDDQEYEYDGHDDNEESMFEEDWESPQEEGDQGSNTRASAPSSPVHQTIEEPHFFLRSDDYEPTAAPATEGGYVPCPTPGYGPGGYQTPEQPNPRRQWTPSPPYHGSYTPGVGVGYETPSQQRPFGQDHDGDSVMGD